jgi:hypothetical protein
MIKSKVHNQKEFEESSEQFIRKKNSIKKCFSNSMTSAKPETTDKKNFDCRD